MLLSKWWQTDSWRWQEASPRQKRRLRLLRMSSLIIELFHWINLIICRQTTDRNLWASFSLHFAASLGWSIWQQARTIPTIVGKLKGRTKWQFHDYGITSPNTRMNGIYSSNRWLSRLALRFIDPQVDPHSVWHCQYIRREPQHSNSRRRFFRIYPAMCPPSYFVAISWRHWHSWLKTSKCELTRSRNMSMTTINANAKQQSSKRASR